MPNMEVIIVYQSKFCRVIQIDLLFENNVYYYGIKINLNGFGCGFAAGPIPNDTYKNGKPYPYKASTRYDAVMKAFDYIIDFLQKHLDAFCRENYDIQYVRSILDHVLKFKSEYINSNLQLSLF